MWPFIQAGAVDLCAFILFLFFSFKIDPKKLQLLVDGKGAWGSCTDLQAL